MGVLAEMCEIRCLTHEILNIVNFLFREKQEDFCLELNERKEKWRKWCRRLNKKHSENIVATRSKFPSDTSESVRVPEYQIEIAPGEWIRTTNETEARFYLRRQKVNENNFGDEEERENLHISDDDDFKLRFSRCLFNAKECKFK